MTAFNLSRRGALFALAALTTTPAIALPESVDAANRLWIERQALIVLLRESSAAYDAASAQLPAWVRSGHRSIDQHGNPCGDTCPWPLDEAVTPPTIEGAWRVARPSISDCQEEFDFQVRVSGATGKYRERCRATMRRNIRAIVARLRERKRIYEQLGLIELDQQMTETCNLIVAVERKFDDLPPLPNIMAARLLVGMVDDCSMADYASGNGYCGTMAMALTALSGLLPALPAGVIRDHVAFFVSNPELPLSAMPFAAI